MEKISTIGLDIAKHVFQVHGSDASGSVVLRRRLRRGEVMGFFTALPRCVVALEACSTSHYWARQLAGLGHDVRLLPPSYVQPYVKRGKKNDAVDAEAICEAVQRPSMRTVPIKTETQQAVLMLHRSREQLVRQRTMLLNALRAQLAEYGLIAPQGAAALRHLATSAEALALPPMARLSHGVLREQIVAAERQIAALERAIIAAHKADEQSVRVATIPGIGPITASAMTASVGDATRFRSGRHFAAWLGLVPRQHSSGGKQRLAGISKRGDRYLRKNLIVGTTSLIRRAPTATTPDAAWLRGLLGRKPKRVVSVARANKAARIAWAIMVNGGVYDPAIGR